MLLPSGSTVPGAQRYFFGSTTVLLCEVHLSAAEMTVEVVPLLKAAVPLCRFYALNSQISRATIKRGLLPQPTNHDFALSLLHYYKL